MRTGSVPVFPGRFAPRKAGNSGRFPFAQHAATPLFVWLCRNFVAFSQIYRDISAILLSHPARGAWIEIRQKRRRYRHDKSRTPQGVRGLKLMVADSRETRKESHPARGAWIEILLGRGNQGVAGKERRHRREPVHVGELRRVQLFEIDERVCNRRWDGNMAVCF